MFDFILSLGYRNRVGKCQVLNMVIQDPEFLGSNEVKLGSPRPEKD